MVNALAPCVVLVVTQWAICHWAVLWGVTANMTKFTQWAFNVYVTLSFSDHTMITQAVNVILTVLPDYSNVCFICWEAKIFGTHSYHIWSSAIVDWQFPNWCLPAFEHSIWPCESTKVGESLSLRSGLRHGWLLLSVFWEAAGEVVDNLRSMMLDVVGFVRRRPMFRKGAGW